MAMLCYAIFRRRHAVIAAIVYLCLLRAIDDADVFRLDYVYRGLRYIMLPRLFLPPPRFAYFAV